MRTACRAAVGAVLNNIGLGPQRAPVLRVQQFLDPELEHEVLRALRQWRFSPALLDGQPIEVRVEVELTLKLRK